MGQNSCAPSGARPDAASIRWVRFASHRLPSCAPPARRLAAIPLKTAENFLIRVIRVICGSTREFGFSPNSEVAAAQPPGSTGDPPVPSGDPPLGTRQPPELFQAPFPKAAFRSFRRASGPTGRAGSPFHPIQLRSSGLALSTAKFWNWTRLRDGWKAATGCGSVQTEGLAHPRSAPGRWRAGPGGSDYGAGGRRPGTLARSAIIFVVHSGQMPWVNSTSTCCFR